MKNEITVETLQKEMEQKTIILIDVRENDEYEYCKIQGSMHIPMNDIPVRMKEISIDNSYAVICHTGVRSGMVCNYLKNIGYNAVNVIGGIDKWSESIDNKVKKY